MRDWFKIIVDSEKLHGKFKHLLNILLIVVSLNELISLLLMPNFGIKEQALSVDFHDLLDVGEILPGEQTLI